MSFVNDLAVTSDGRKIYFTDSSSKWQRREYPLLVMEGTDDGRQVFLYSPSKSTVLYTMHRQITSVLALNALTM